MARVLITGCSTGFGRAAAIELANRGHEVIATARRPETLEDLDVKERLALDVTSDASVAAAIDAAGEIDVLVNNAGIDVHGPIEKVTLTDVQRLFDTNVFGPVRTMQAVIPMMRERGHGTIVNVSSVAGVVTAPLLGYYSGTKHALEAISEAASFELGHFGIRVVLIEPGEFETNIQQTSPQVGMDAPPYDELARLWEGAQALLSGGVAIPGPEPVAVVIADAIESDATPVHVPVGADAEMVVVVPRESMDYETFVATMRETLQLDW